MAQADPQHTEQPAALPPKPAHKSKAILGAIVAMLPAVLTMCGVELEDEAAQEVGGAVVTIVGAIIAIYGRIAARRPIGKEGAL